MILLAGNAGAAPHISSLMYQWDTSIPALTGENAPGPTSPLPPPFCFPRPPSCSFMFLTALNWYRSVYSTVCGQKENRDLKGKRAKLQTPPSIIQPPWSWESLALPLVGSYRKELAMFLIAQEDTVSWDRNKALFRSTFSLETASIDSQDVERCAGLRVDVMHGLAHCVISNRRNERSHWTWLCYSRCWHLQAAIQQTTWMNKTNIYLINALISLDRR